MSMICETIKVDRDGKMVIINLSDFNPKTMIKWGETPSAAINIASKLEAPPLPQSANKN
jgi:hypothetical protein